MPKAVITGAAGFAGYSVTKELMERGYEVYAVLRPGSEHNSRLDDLSENLHRIELDCSDFDKISVHIPTGCELFFHLAWFGGRDDFNTQKQNIDFCLKALESACRAECGRFIGIGSQAEYGVSEGIIDEKSYTNPFSSYGAAKLSAMYLSRNLASQLGIEWVWGRIFSLYGDYEPSGRMLPDLLSNLRTDKNVHLSSCEQMWDFLHARDAASALVLLGEKGCSGELYNIANGQFRPLKEYVESAKEQFEYKGIINYGDKADPFVSLMPDVSKLMNDTGWKPSIEFEKGIFEYYS